MGDGGRDEAIDGGSTFCFWGQLKKCQKFFVRRNEKFTVRAWSDVFA